MAIKHRSTSALVMLPNDLVEQIKQYKTNHKIRTRYDAIRALIKKGLEADSEEENSVSS